MTTRRDLLKSGGVLTAAVALQHAGGVRASALQQASPTAGGYAHPEWLVDPGWVQSRLGDQRFRVVALQAEAAFSGGHIPGSARIDWPELEIGDTSAASLESWRSTVANQIAGLGITPGDTVVVYDPETLWGARIWWVLAYLGHPDIRMLNGGFAAWAAAGGETETGPSVVSSAAEYTAEHDDEVIATIDEVKMAVADGTATFVDARSAEEYAAGHIPGAVNIPYTSNAIDTSPKFFKGAEELQAMYADAGLRPDRPVIPYCTSGVRSAVTYFTLRLIGYEQVSLFTGSWNEWSSDPSLPVTTGDTP